MTNGAMNKYDDDELGEEINSSNGKIIKRNNESGTDNLQLKVNTSDSVSLFAYTIAETCYYVCDLAIKRGSGCCNFSVRVTNHGMYVKVTIDLVSALYATTRTLGRCVVSIGWTRNKQGLDNGTKSINNETYLVRDIMAGGGRRCFVCNRVSSLYDIITKLPQWISESNSGCQLLVAPRHPCHAVSPPVTVRTGLDFLGLLVSSSPKSIENDNNSCQKPVMHVRLHSRDDHENNNGTSSSLVQNEIHDLVCQPILRRLFQFVTTVPHGPNNGNSNEIIKHDNSHLTNIASYQRHFFRPITGTHNQNKTTQRKSMGWRISDRFPPKASSENDLFAQDNNIEKYKMQNTNDDDNQ
jgi:hypothetical protein